MFTRIWAQRFSLWCNTLGNAKGGVFQPTQREVFVTQPICLTVFRAPCAHKKVAKMSNKNKLAWNYVASCISIGHWSHQLWMFSRHHGVSFTVTALMVNELIIAATFRYHVMQNLCMLWVLVLSVIPNGRILFPLWLHYLTVCLGKVEPLAWCQTKEDIEMCF